MVSSPATERMLVDTFIMYIVGTSGSTKDALDGGGKDHPGDVGVGGIGPAGGASGAGGGGGAGGSTAAVFTDESNALLKVRCCFRCYAEQHPFAGGGCY